MQSTREQNKSKRANKRRNSRKKSLSPSNFKTIQNDLKTEKKFECKRSLSEGSVKAKHRKSNIRRTLSHPEKIPDVKKIEAEESEVVECVNTDVINISEKQEITVEENNMEEEVRIPTVVSDDSTPIKEGNISDADSNLPLEMTSSDRDTEDERRMRFVGGRRSDVRGLEWVRQNDALLRFGRQQFAADSGSDLESLAASTVRRVSVRRRRGTPDTGWSEEPFDLDSGRMRPEDYRLVFLSSDSSCKEDEDSSSTSSVAPLFQDDCDWDYFEPGARHVPAPAPSPPCHRACSCGAEPRIVAVPVPVPVPVPAALWPSLLVYPDAGTQPWSLFNFPKGYPFANFDATELAKFAQASPQAPPPPPAPTVDMSSERKSSSFDNELKNLPSNLSSEPKVSKVSPPETVEKAPPVEDSVDSPKEAPPVIEELIENDSENIKVIAEDCDEVFGHLQSEDAFCSSNDSAESTDAETERRYEIAGEPEEPVTSDADSDASSSAGGGFARVFVVNPADSSSDVEDNADSSGIECSEGEDKKYDCITIEEALLNDRNSVFEVPKTAPPPPPPENTETPSESNDLTGLDPGRTTSKCSDFIKFCDLNMLRGQVAHGNSETNCDKKLISSITSDEKSAGAGHRSDSEINCSSEKIENFNDAKENSSCDSRTDEKVKVPEACDRSADTVTTGEDEIATGSQKSTAHASPELRPSSPVARENRIDLLKGIERTLSDLLKNESSFERREKPRSRSESGGEKSAEEAGSPRSGAPVDRARAVSRSRSAGADARYTSRVMITHDHVSVVSSDTTRVMRDVTVHHTNLQSEAARDRAAESAPDEDETDVRVVTNADTLSAVVCLEEGLADDDSWVEDVSHDEEAGNSTATDSDSGEEATLSPSGGAEFTGYCRRSLDFTLHTIVEESCEESDAEHVRRSRPISATELEKYFYFGLGDGRHDARDDEEPEEEETSSVCSDGAESIVGNEGSERGDDDLDVPEELASSRLEKYFLSGFMGFNQERRDSDGSGSVGSDSEGRHSPEHRRKRLVRARGTPRSHSSSLDNLITGEEASQDVPDDSAGSSTETENCHDSNEHVDQDGKRKKNKKSRNSPADDRRHSAEFSEEVREDARSISEGEEANRSPPRQEFPPLSSELSESKKQASRDSGFVGSCDDLLRNGDSSAEVRSEQKPELEEIIEENRQENEERSTAPRVPSPLARKDSFNNWSSDEETNLMMTKMRQFFKTMVEANRATPPGDTSTPNSQNSNGGRRPPKPPQLLYFETELTRLMKTVPGIRDEEVREIVEYLSSEDTWSDSYDSSDYAGSDLEGSGVGRSALRRQISESCREIIDEFDKGKEREHGPDVALERDAACAYQKLVASLGRAAVDGTSPRGSPPLVAKVMRHIGGRLVALMHEVSSGESSVPSPRPRPPRRARPASATTTEDDDSASDASGALPRSRSHDILEAARARGDEREASDCDRFSWRGSFESALLAADSRGTLAGGETANSRRSAGDLLAAQRTQSRSCGAIGGSEDRLWRGRRRSSAPDDGEGGEDDTETRAGSLPRLPSGAAAPVKSARYRAPGFSRATRALSAPGLHAGLASRARRRLAPHAPHTPTQSPATPQPSIDDVLNCELSTSSPASATLPRRSSSPLPPLPHDTDDLYRLGLGSHNKSGLQGRSESMASVYSGAGEGARGSVAVRGSAQFSLIYNYKLGALEVGVKRCRDLAPVDVKRNRSDPYVKVYLLPDKSKCGKRKTKVKKNTLNPTFEETLRFAQPLDALLARTLWLSVWSADMFGRNDFLGEVTLPLADMVFDDTAPKWYPLQERTEQFEEQQGSKGDVILGLKFETLEGSGARAKGTLHVLVKEAKNLVATKPNGLADAFCKSYLLPERGRLAKQKSSVVRRSLNPRWEHAFTYRGVTLQELAQRALELSVWDKDRISSNDFMGGVRLSLGSGSYMGTSVNWLDSVGKEVTLWQTMMQRPNFWVEGSLPLRSHLSS